MRKSTVILSEAKNLLLMPDKFLAKLFIAFIKLYQRTVSPDHSTLGKTNAIRCCKFYPTCSEYAVQTLQKQGFLWGVPKVFWRILRCHPWSRGGIDLP